MKAPERFETERLVLRRPQLDDAELVFSTYASDREVSRYLAWRLHQSPDTTRSFLEFSDDEWQRWPAGPYLIESRADGRLIGGTGFAFETHYRASTGYVFARDAWGQGYATEAVNAIVEIGKDIGIVRLYALCHVDHARSARVLERAGFTCEGVLQSYLEFPNLAPGEPADVHCYARVLNGPTAMIHLRRSATMDKPPFAVPASDGQSSGVRAYRRHRVVRARRLRQRRSSSACSRNCSPKAARSRMPGRTSTTTAISICSSGSAARPIGSIATTRACSPKRGGAAGLSDARATRAAAWGDFDRDGDPDLLVGFTPGATSVLQLYRNERPIQQRHRGRRASASSPAPCGSRSWVDVDADGDLDLFVAFRDRANALFRNDDGRFTDIAPEVGPRRCAPNRRRRLVRLRQRRRSRPVRGEHGRRRERPVQEQRRQVHRRRRGCRRRLGRPRARGRGQRHGARLRRRHRRRRPARSVHGELRPERRVPRARWRPIRGRLRRRGATKNTGKHDTCALADIDNDGRLDVYRKWHRYRRRQLSRLSAAQHRTHVRGRDAGEHPRACRRRTARSGPTSMATATWTWRLPARVPTRRIRCSAICCRRRTPRRSLSVRVVDADGRATRAGALVRVRSTKTKRVLAVRLVDAGSGYDSQNDMPVHIGLAAMEPVDIEVVWPANGTAVTATVSGSHCADRRRRS